MMKGKKYTASSLSPPVMYYMGPEPGVEASYMQHAHLSPSTHLALSHCVLLDLLEGLISEVGELVAGLPLLLHELRELSHQLL